MLVKVFVEVAAVVADRLSPFKHLAGGVQVFFLHALASLVYLMSLGFFRTDNSSNTGNPRNGRKANIVKRVYVTANLDI